MHPLSPSLRAFVAGWPLLALLPAQQPTPATDEPAVIHGQAPEGASRMVLSPITSYVVDPYAEALVDTEGRFTLRVAVPTPRLCQLLVYTGRRRSATLPLYLLPGQALKVHVAGKDSEFEGAAARQNRHLYGLAMDLRRHTMVANREGKPEKAAAFLAELDSKLDAEELPAPFRSLLQKVARWEVDLTRVTSLGSKGGEPLQACLEQLASHRPGPEMLSVRDWHWRLSTLTTALAAAGLLPEAENDLVAVARWIEDPQLRSAFCVHRLGRLIQGKRWFRDPLRPRIAPLEGMLVGDVDRAAWRLQLDRLSAMEQEFAHLAVGKPAPVFRFGNPTGEVVSLADFRGKFVVLDFWNTRCVPCLAQVPHIQRMEKQLEEHGIVFVSISADSQAEKQRWRECITERKMTGTQLLLDQGFDSQFLKDYCIKGFPTFSVIDPDGRIADPFYLRPEDPAFVPGLIEIRDAYLERQKGGERR